MKLAIIGSYGHTGLTLDHLARTPHVQLAAVARHGPQDPLAFVGRHSASPVGLPAYDDYRRMLQDIRPDIVSVYMPMHRIAEACIAAARAGCHVFSEKPLATMPEDLAALRAAVNQAGVQLMAMLEYRCHSGFLALRQCIRAGRIGRPLLATAQKSYPFAVRDEVYQHRQTYGGTIPYIGVHAVDLISWALGRPFTRVAAFHGNSAHPQRPGMEDGAAILLEVAGGGQAVATVDFLRPWGARKLPWGDDRLRVAGSEGVVETLDHGRAARLLTAAGFEDLPLPPPVSLWETFVNACQGRGACAVPPDDALYATEVCLRARQAADEGRTIDLTDVLRSPVTEPTC